MISKEDIEKEKDTYVKKMSENLQELRNSLHLSQTELGEYASVSRQTISEIERGEYHMSWNQFTSFYMVFGANKASHEVLEETGLGIQNLAPVIVVTKSKDCEKEKTQDE